MGSMVENACIYFKSILIGFLTLVVIKLSHGLENYFIDEKKYLISFNDVRTKFDLLPIDTAIHYNVSLFKDWKSYFGPVKRDYYLDIYTKKVQRNCFSKKIIRVENKQISFEKDRYEKNQRAIEISYDYIDKISKYRLYEYELGHKGDLFAKEEIYLSRQQCLDTLKVWYRNNEFISY